MLLRKNVLLADEMGLGKTIQIIGMLNLMWTLHMTDTPFKKVLGICPNNLRYNWISEIRAWADPTMLTELWGDDIEQCTSAAYFPHEIIICSYEGMTRYNYTLQRIPWDLIIVDEAHYVKNRDAKRSKALYAFGDQGSNGTGVAHTDDDTDINDDLASRTAKKILLTGTPISNYPYEIAPLLVFLDKEQWPSIRAIEKRYCPYGNKYGYNLEELSRFLREGKLRNTDTTERISVVDSMDNSWVCVDTCRFQTSNDLVAHAHVKELKHHLRIMRTLTPKVEIINHHVNMTGLMIRRLKKDVLPELPRKRRQIIGLPAEGELLELVQQENALWDKAKDVKIALEKALDDLVPETLHEHDKSFEDVITMMQQTRRYFFDEIAIIRHRLAVAKVPYVIEHVENLLENKDKLVLFFHHNDVGEALFQHFGSKSVLVYGKTSMPDRQAFRERFWKDVNCELFLGAMKVAGEGLNLQVASNIVFAESDWVPGTLTQCEDRCHRIGQEYSLLVQHLVAQDSMDAKILQRVVAKQKSIRKALDRKAEVT